MTAQLRHTGIVVSDLDAALHFYGELLGFETVRRAGESGAALDNVLALDGTQVTTVKMAAGNGQIELLHFDSPARQAKRNGQLAADSLGLTHIALTVDDLDATYARLEAAGVRFNAPPQVSADGRVKLTYCRDPDGSFVELVEVLNGTRAQPTNGGGFVEVTEEGYTDLLIRRLKGEEPELTFVQQFRGLLAADLTPGASLLDVGCATGYAYHGFRGAGLAYTGIDIEERYLGIARDWFAGRCHVVPRDRDQPEKLGGWHQEPGERADRHARARGGGRRRSQGSDGASPGRSRAGSWPRWCVFCAVTTQGRGRYDRDKLYDKPRKDIWLRPLRKDWKRALNR